LRAVSAAIHDAAARGGSRGSRRRPTDTMFLSCAGGLGAQRQQCSTACCCFRVELATAPTPQERFASASAAPDSRLISLVCRLSVAARGQAATTTEHRSTETPNRTVGTAEGCGASLPRRPSTTVRQIVVACRGRPCGVGGPWNCWVLPARGPALRCVGDTWTRAWCSQLQLHRSPVIAERASTLSVAMPADPLNASNGRLTSGVWADDRRRLFGAQPMPPW
jgi:hypothetical protein